MTPQKILLRIHRMFETMPLLIWEALRSYIFQKDRKAKAVLRKSAYEYFSSVRKEGKPIAAVGSTYDLQEMYDKVKSEYFPSLDKDVAIGWAKKRNRGRGRCMTFGCYDPHHRQIRIHPRLDHPLVPSYFIEFVIYHEILHIACPPQVTATGRINAHTREFRLREKNFFDYLKAKSFEKKFFLFI